MRYDIYIYIVRRQRVMVLHLIHVREVRWLFNNTLNTEHHIVPNDSVTDERICKEAIVA